MAAFRGLSVLAAAAVLFRCAFAATITVGAPNGGWDQTTDLKTWAASQKFTTGDTLVFKYSALHNVEEVSKADYDACRTSATISSYSNGNTAIPLPASGKRYFICGTPGHCGAGMKLEVDVVSAASAPAPTSPTTPAPPKSSPVPRAPEKSPSPSSPAASPPTAPKNTPSPSSPPEPASSAGPAGSPPVSTPSTPSSTGSPPRGPPSVASGLKTSAAAGFVCGLLMLLAF